MQLSEAVDITRRRGRHTATGTSTVWFRRRADRDAATEFAEHLDALEGYEIPVPFGRAFAVREAGTTTPELEGWAKPPAPEPEGDGPAMSAAPEFEGWVVARRAAAAGHRRTRSLNRAGRSSERRQV
jgi:hypothetical protein